MNNQFELGTPLNIQWHFKRPDGENYSLAGQQPTLYCINARGRFMVPSVVMNAEGGYLSFTLDRRMQVCSGEYSFLLQLRQNGVRVNDVIYRDAVTLVRTGTAMSTQEAAYNNVPPTIQLFTVGEFNLYTPTAPVGGADGYWYFNGQRILDETDTEVAAYFSLKFTREGENRGRITIYKGNADVDVEPVVVDTFDAVKVALDTVDYEMDPDNDGEEQGDHESWAHKVEVTWQDNETTRQSQESTRQSNETTRKNNEGIGTTDAECAAGSRRKNESIRVANESTRQSQEGTRQSNETTRGQKETARQKAEGQLGSSDPDYDTSRIKNELDRQEAESRRQTNEGIGATDAECAAGSRRKNESIRQTNEATRQAQEGSATDGPSASGSRWARYKYNEGTDAGSEAGDASRWGKFKEQEGTLDSSEADDGSRWGQYKEEEGTEDSSYTEHSRWGNYRAAEITRGNDYSEAEGTADGSTSGDGSRWGSYKLQEGANTDAASASGSRWARYKKAENDRETAYGTAEGSATDSPSAGGSRWARFNKAQADRDQAIAPAIGIYDCDTAAATADKTVSASDYILASGGAIKIKFQYANSAASPTLNINSQGAKAIVFNGAVASASNTWGAGEVVEFYYDPTYNSNAGGFIGRSTVVNVSQNTETGHTDISVGDVITPVTSIEEFSQLQTKVDEKDSGIFISEKLVLKSDIFEIGSISTSGQETTLAGLRSIYIPVSLWGKYVVTPPTAPNDNSYNVIVSFASYDGAKNFISRQNFPNVNPDPLEFTISPTVKYIRIVLLKKSMAEDYPMIDFSNANELDAMTPFYFAYEKNPIDNYERIDKLPFLKDNVENDFSIEDEYSNRILNIFQGGELQTKKFNSCFTPSIDDSDETFDIQDNDGSSVLRIGSGGYLRTKGFDSRLLEIPTKVINRYRGKRISIIGDSISTFGTPDARNQDGKYCYSYYPTTTCRYSEQGNVTEGGVTYESIKFDVNDTWWMRLINAVDGRLGINNSWRGSSVSSVRGAGNAISSQARISTLGENGNPDLILVYGGTNDAGAGVEIGTFNTDSPKDYTQEQIDALPIDTFANAYRTMLIRLMKTYQSSEIVCILPTFTSAYYTIDDLDNYVELIKEACDFFGIKWIDIRVTGISVYNKNKFLVDGIHPNAMGMKVLFEKIYKQLIFN